MFLLGNPCAAIRGSVYFYTIQVLLSIEMSMYFHPAKAGIYLEWIPRLRGDDNGNNTVALPLLFTTKTVIVSPS